MSGGRIRSVRFKDGYTADSLTNAVSGIGTRSDPRVYNRYAPSALTQYDIAAAYDGSGMMAKVIDIPALDMVREWRNWQADAKQIKLLEAEERRLDIRGKVRLAETYRGLGGGAFIIGLAGDASSPAPATIGAKGIAYIHVVTRWQLAMGPEIEDHTNPGFGGPEWFSIRTTLGEQKIHPSRVICFKGDPVPPILGQSWEDKFWGRSRVQRVLDAVQNSDSAQGAFAGLVTKARNVIIGIPGLMDLVSDADGEAALQRRLAAMILGEGMYNATLRDAGDGSAGAGETIDHRQVNWAGIPEIMMAFAIFLAAVSDIPATRLLSKSPDGQNSTGESDNRNWNKMVRAKQTLELGPCIDQLDRFLLPSAGVAATEDAEVWAEWAPLDTPSEKEAAETFKTTMEAVEKVQATNAIPDEAFAKSFQNLLVENGWMPGLEGALAEIPENERFGLNPDDGGDDDPSALQAEGGDPDLAGRGGSRTGVARRATNDAWMLEDWAAKPLYVRRDVINRADIVKWARSQGFTDIADDLHVTITYSRAPVDWMAMGESWRGKLEIEAGGPRLVEALGPDGKYKALLFTAYELVSRNQEMRDKGASFDWPGYQPHISIQVGGDIDLAVVEPYRGKIVLGPEIFEEIRSGD